MVGSRSLRPRSTPAPAWNSPTNDELFQGRGIVRVECETMTNEECRRRAVQCAANASVSPDTSLAQEFLTLAAHWRAMAVREIFLGHVDGPVDQPGNFQNGR